MKRIFKFLSVALCMLFLVGLNTAYASAASAPAKVSGLTAKSSDGSIVLKWKKVSKANGYNIYVVNTSNGQKKKLASTTKTTYTIKKLKHGARYSFQVYAYKKSGSTKVESVSPSATVAATVKYSNPSTPKSFRYTATGDKSVTLKWSKASKASGYVLYKYNEDTNTYEQYKKYSSGTSKVTLKSLTAGKTYKFRLRSYRKAGGATLWSGYSSTVSVKITAFSSDVKSVRTPKYTVKLRSTITVTNLTTGKKQTLKKGTKLQANSKNSKTTVAYLSNGDKVKVSRSKLKYTGLTKRKTDYSKSTKENFVNAKGYSSPSKYLIWVSEYTLKINIFKGSRGKWKLAKTYSCCVGKWSTRTAHGLRRILKKIYYGEYGGPYIWFSPGEGSSQNPQGCAFHNYVDGNRSKAVSHGCVRTSVSALKYIYNNCPVGTTVLVY